MKALFIHSFVYSFVMFFIFVLNIQTQAKSLGQPWPSMSVSQRETIEWDDKRHYIFSKETGVLKTENYDIEYGGLFYRSREPREKLIVLTPNIRGVTVLERRLAHYLAKRGFHVLVPLLEHKLLEEDSFSFEGIERSQKDFLWVTKAIIEDLKEQWRFDDQSIGLAGVSLGGIRSSLLMGSDDIFKAMFISVAGSDLPEIYALSEHPIVNELRGRHMRQVGVTDKREYESLLRRHLELDSSIVTRSPYLDNIAMIIADEDKIVPSINLWKLWKAIKAMGHRPKTYVKECEHVMGALYLLRYQRHVYDWMVARL